MKLNLFSKLWWKAALLRAVRTALVIAVPYLGAGVALVHGLGWVPVVSAAGLGFVLSLVTSLTGIAEASGGVLPLWYSLLERVVKTLAQAIVAGIGNAVLFQDVHWVVILQNAAVAGLGSLVLAVIAKLPEAVATTVPVGTVTTVDGVTHVGVLPASAATTTAPAAVATTGTPAEK